VPIIYPSGLDTFNNPSPSDHLDDPLVLHHQQHSDINDAVVEIEDWIGVSGSLVPYTIEFRLHNTSLGHNHDGYNSRPVALGPPQFGSGPTYPIGYYSDFTNTTRVGSAVDRLNQALLTITSGSSTTFQYNGIVINPSGTTIVNISGSSETVVAFGSGSTITYFFSESLKETSRKLILLADGGPFEGYATGAFRTIGYEANKIFATESIWFTDSSMTSKIVSEKITYGPKRTVSVREWKAYATDGSTVLSTVTDNIYYRSVFEVSRSRTIL